MTMKPGWLGRQLQAASDSVATWPAWMRRGSQMTDNVYKIRPMGWQPAPNGMKMAVTGLGDFFVKPRDGQWKWVVYDGASLEECDPIQEGEAATEAEAVNDAEEYYLDRLCRMLKAA